MGLRTRFTLFFSLIFLIFIVVFSTVVYQQVRVSTLAHEEQTLLGLLDHEWDHVDLPDHHSNQKPGVPHFKDVYLRIRKDGAVLYDSFQSGIQEPQVQGLDLENRRIFRSVQRERAGSRYEIVGYYDLIPTLNYLRFLKNILIVGCLASLLVVVPLGWWATRFLLKPFRELAAKTSEISPHELSFRFEIPKVTDEFGTLARNFNSLLERLEKSFHQVKRFASNVSHELRTPLAVIIGQSEVALRREREGEEYRQVISKTLARAQHLSSVIDRLLYLSDVERMDAVEMELLDLNQAINEVIATVATALPSSKHIEACSLTPSLKVLSNRQLFSSIFTNLLENALKNSKSRVLVSWQSTEEGIQICVEDDGPGIPIDKRKVVFEPFVKLPQENTSSAGPKGHGLGLSIVRACVQALKGSVRIDASELGGAAVAILFPVSRPTDPEFI